MADATPLRMVDGQGREQLRVRLDARAGSPVVRLDVMSPLAAHAPNTLCTKGPAVVIPVASVAALCEALDGVRREAGYDGGGE